MQIDILVHMAHTFVSYDVVQEIVQHCPSLLAIVSWLANYSYRECLIN